MKAHTSPINYYAIAEALNAIRTLSEVLQPQLDAENNRIAYAAAVEAVAKLPLIVKTYHADDTTPTGKRDMYFVEISDGKHVAYFRSLEKISHLTQENLQAVEFMDSGFFYFIDRSTGKINQMPPRGRCRRNMKKLKEEAPTARAYMERCLTVPAHYGAGELVYLAQ